MLSTVLCMYCRRGTSALYHVYIRLIPQVNELEGLIMDEQSHRTPLGSSCTSRLNSAPRCFILPEGIYFSKQLYGNHMSTLCEYFIRQLALQQRH